MEKMSFDVIVVGSGAAGLRAAISAREAGLSVCVISKGTPGKSTCTGFSAGVMAGSSSADTRGDHLERTLAAGRGLNDHALVEVLVEEAPLRIEELMRWGIRAEFQSGYLYAKGRPPVLGEEINRCLIRKGAELGVHFMGNLPVADLSVGDGAVAALAYRESSSEWVAVGAGALVLATGGSSALYLRNDNPKRMLGDGFRLAYEAGAKLRDVEFTQFYPLCLAEPGLNPLVIPPRLADCGRLFNDRGEDILEKYGIGERPAGEMARDRLSQALFREIWRNGAAVRLDLRNLSEEEWRIDPFAVSVRSILDRHGAGSRPLRVAPAAHHIMGGVMTDAFGATSVPGLYAAGETAGGIHGANRMGGNALSETLVFGARAGKSAADRATGTGARESNALFEALSEKARRWTGGCPRTEDLASGLRNVMWTEGGIVRNENGLSRALNTVREIRREAMESVSAHAGKELIRHVELISSTEVATIILEAALGRRESRGAHFREDFPERNDREWSGHLTVRLAPDGRRSWEFEPVSGSSGTFRAKSDRT